MEPQTFQRSVYLLVPNTPDLQVQHAPPLRTSVQSTTVHLKKEKRKRCVAKDKLELKLGEVSFT